MKIMRDTKFWLVFHSILLAFAVMDDFYFGMIINTLGLVIWSANLLLDFDIKRLQKQIAAREKELNI